MRGTTIAGRYRLVEAIGSGGMGDVWRADDLWHGHAIALKIISLGEGDSVREAAFRREAGVAARLSHPNVVSVHDYGTADLGGQRALFLAMELVEGQPLSALCTGPLPIADIVTWAAQISRALHAAHQADIVHRDIKPSNVLIDRCGARLCDFGIARLAGTHHTLTVTGTAIGTPAYMSPEQARGDKDVAAPSDMYSLGCTIHELLTGRTPFDGAGWHVIHQHLHQSPAAASILRPNTPRDLEQLVLELLDKDPGRRPTAAQTLDRLDQLRTAVAPAAEPTLTAPTPPTAPTVVDARPPAPHPPRPRRTAPWTGTVTGAAIAAELTWAVQMPHLWAITLGVVAGLLVSGIHLLDLPRSRPEELQVTTVGLFTMLLIALGSSVGLLLSHPSMWPAALAVAVLGGPVLVAGTTTVRHTVQHVLHSPARQADLASTAGALHTTTLLLAADHAGFSVLAMLAAGLVLWPATALITALLTSGTSLGHRTGTPKPPVCETPASGRANRAGKAVSRV
jgi:serine/threonine-protein kinase